MKTMQISEHTTQLVQSAILFPVNCYLVREDDGLTVIDTAIGGCAPGIIKAAQQLGAPIVRLVLTHGHGDHIGSLAALHAALPAAEILYSAREARILAGDMGRDPGEAQGPIKGSYAKTNPTPTRTFQPGEHVGSLEVIAAPGHTPGQVAFFDPRDGLLIAGDALSTYDGIAVAGIARPIFPFLKWATWDLPTATKTVRQLRDMHPTLLAVGHGRALRDPADAMMRAIAVAERRGA